MINRKPFTDPGELGQRALSKWENEGGAIEGLHGQATVSATTSVHYRSRDTLVSGGMARHVQLK